MAHSFDLKFHQLDLVGLVQYTYASDENMSEWIEHVLLKGFDIQFQLYIVRRSISF